MKTRTNSAFQILLSAFLLLGLFNPLGPSAVAAARPAASFAPAAPVVNWCLAGSLNGWNNASTPLYDDGTHGDLFKGDGMFSIDYTIAAAGRNEWKIVECGNWNNAYPAANAWVNTSAANQVVKFTFDTNDHSQDAGLALLPAKNIVNAWDSLPASFTAVGDFQGWNNADPATALTDLGHGLYRLAYAISAPGSYIGKVTTTGAWDAFGGDGRSTDAQNISFATTAANEVVICLLDTRTGRLAIANNKAGTGNWCLAGSLNGWNNASTPLYDDGTHGDLAGGDGVFSLDFSVAAAGRNEWKIVECGNWNNAYPAANAWVNTSAANQVVKFTFDTNDHTQDAGLALLPAKNIVNAWDSLPASFTAVGDFQGWNNADPATALTDLGHGLQAAYVPVATAGRYIGKITTTGAWDAFGGDGRSTDAQNVSFQTRFANDAVFFL
ncbi:MAG TPA: choice-of-anchor X domain-containing protein, partial [Anaerolineales bacterium]